jgi:hypothetical protein
MKERKKLSSKYLYLVMLLIPYAALCISSAAAFEPEGVNARLQVESLWGGPGILGRDYIVIGWNDLGMHCISPGFSEMAILPPYNNLMVQVIKRGDPPRVVTDGISIEYSMVNNSSCSGKTDFWVYAKQLFNADLPEGTGLTGIGLSGTMVQVDDHFEAKGIPLLPYDDSMNWNPYQTAAVKLKNRLGMVVKTTQVVLPVSDELHCDKCHADNGDAGPDIATGTVEGNILTVHDIKSKTSLMAKRPVLCASCHADNALGMKGEPLRRSLSEAMHGWHGAIKGDQPGCYDCHPGAKTQCNRSAIPMMGNYGSEPNCSDCHGDLRKMGDSVAQGRQPWLEEPACSTCHGQIYSTGNALYRNSRGQGGIYCSACHNSPHAYWPSKNTADNIQPAKLQGFPMAIGICSVCHTGGNKIGYNPHWQF